ncbi:MAG: molybdenum ABC transporter ATP-binding protein [Gemmatimonadota bacterium]
MSVAADPAERLRIDVRKRLGSFELAADLDLPLAGLTALFGASGAGKSTLINLVAGLLVPDAGRIAAGATVFVDRAQATELPVERRALGYVFQDARLFPHLSVRENLRYGARRAVARATAPGVTFDHVVHLLGLDALLARPPHTLSGGEKQRVALGRALLAQPRLLLMDEPLAALDVSRKSEVMPYIERLRDELGIPILYVSHSIDEVLRLATALVLLDGGRVLAAGPIDSALQSAAVRAHLGAAELGSLVFARVRGHDEAWSLSTLEGDGFELRVPRVALPVGATLRARIPARDVALALACPADVSILNRIEGRIAALAPQADGPYADVTVHIGAATEIVARVTRESVGRLALAPGMTVWCLVKSVALDAGALALASGRAVDHPARG